MAGAVGFLADLNDQWLKPRLLRVVVGEQLPQPGSTVPPSELASILDAVRTHGLLTEAIQGPPDRKLAEAWRAAVDAWVQRVGELLQSDSPHSRWLGTCFLGVTFQDISNERFLESYSDWFEKILTNLQEPSSSQLATDVSCTSMSDLFVRLAKFLNLKKEASSFAGRVVEPLLLLLNENGPVADEAIDLLRTVIKLYPSSLNRHYNKVESAIAAKVMSAEVNVNSSKKFARVLAMLPSVRVSEGSWSLMIQKILIGVNNLLNDAFVGLEEEKKGREIMMLLVPPGNDPPPVLGDQIKLGGNLHVTKKFRVFTVPTISALAHCCCVMLTSYYPVQVNVPVRALLALLRRVLLVDGSLHNKKFPSTTSLHQELICFELPSLHSSFLDLLHATIKGMRSQLLPHAANIVRLIADYFKIAKLPAMRTKVYSIVQLLLTSMGVGMSLHLLEVIVSNAVGDLDDSCVNEMTLLSTNPTKVTSESSSKSYSKKRKQEPQIQNSHASGLEKAAASPKKRKTSSTPTASKGMTPETASYVTPLCIKIAALETLEILLNVGGSLRTDHWRAKVDLLLINIARSACDSGAGYEQSTSTAGETSISDFRLASFKALLASFLSSPYARPPYLAQGIELFRRGKLEIGTNLAEFCSHALLALDVLTHPRALSLERAGPLVPGLNHSGPEKIVFGAGRSKFSQSEGQFQVIENEDSDDDWLPSTKDNEPKEELTLVKEDPQTDSRTVPEAVQAVPTHNKSDVNNMVDAATEETHKLKTVDNPTSSNAVPNPIYSRPPGTQIPAVAPVDLLLINIARSACDSGAGYEQSTSTAGETSISDFRLASFKALLASFLSSPYARPPYLAQGIELFRRGKLEIGTNLAEFCSHALLALDVLTHPRALSLERAGPLVPGLNHSGPEKIVFGAGRSKFSQSEGQFQVIENEDSDDDWLPSTKDNEPTEELTLVKEDPQTDSRTVPEAVQAVPTHNKSDVNNMVDAATEETHKLKTVDNPTSSNAVPNPIYSRPLGTQIPAVAPVYNPSSSTAVSNPIYSRPTETQKPAVTTLPADLVERLQNRSSAVLQNKTSDVPSGNLGTSYQTPSVPSLAPSHTESSPTRFTLPIQPAFSDGESEDSMPDIVDADPDSDYDY
ncbi:proline-, glutamic acid- and leucine-rich protein 1 isoform X4 [Lolium rigidum]|uniref:proline-, glutamic acid- and leucine-rich protein 1 isoform X4 n=1 Tax=Lolium rigidum TaxID=89674 RepID=UPI001F5C38B6|nr:proline-, glutamic acid- and leucine-rich protein 1 isoform X4 [Lolium rigidum]